jgi:branched-chain amino acid transport system substrate-binding protein
MKFVSRVALAALVVGVFGGGAQAQEKIKIGIVADFTGPYATSGIQFRNGVELFLAERGNKVGGREVEIIYRDTAGANPALSRQLTEELIVRERVSLLGGYYFTPNAAAVSQIITEAKIPTTVFIAATPSLTRQSPYFVRVGYTSWQSAVIAAQYALKTGKKRAYIAVSDFAPGHDSQEAFKKTFVDGGGQIVGEDRMPLNTNDYAPFVQRIANAKADSAFMFLPVGPGSIGFIKSYVERGLLRQGVQLFGTAETDDLDLPALGPAAEGIITSFFYAPGDPNPVNQKFLAGLKKKFGDAGAPNFGAVTGYDGMQVMYKMIEAQAGKKWDPDAAVQAAKGLKLASPRGPIEIDAETRDIVQTMYIRRVENAGGKLSNVYIDSYPAVKDPWKVLNK